MPGLDVARASGRRRVRDTRLAHFSAVSVMDVADDIVERAEAAWLYEAAQTALSPVRSKLILMLADGHDLSQIAAELGLSRRGVESQLYQARRVLRELHAKTLTVIVGCIAALRRGFLPAAPTVTLAALLMIAPVIVGSAPPPVMSTPGGDGARPLANAAESASGAGSMIREKSPTGRRAPTPRARQHSAGPTDSSQERILTIRDPAGSTQLQRRETGGGEQGPVEVLTACLQNLRVEPSHIGC